MSLSRFGAHSLGILLLNGIQTVLVAVAFVRAANVLGPTEFGTFSFAYSIGSFAPLLAGLGGDHVLIMQGSRTPALLPVLLGNATVVRAFLSALMGALAAAVVSQVWPEQGQVVLLSVAASLVGAFAYPLFGAALRVRGAFQRPALYSIFGQVVFAAGVYQPWLNISTAASLMAVYLGGQAVVSVIAAIDAGRGCGWSVSLARGRQDLGLGAVFAVSQVADLAFQRLDVIALQILLGARAVGEYAAGYRIVSVLLAIPAAIHMVLLPEFHRAARHPERLRVLFAQTRRAFVELSALVFGGLFALAPALSSLLYTNEYSHAGAVIRVCSFAGVAIFLAVPYSMLAEAMNRVRDRLRWRLGALGTGAVVSIPCVLWLGPIGAGMGAAVGAGTYLATVHGALGTATRWAHLTGDLSPLGVAVGAATLAGFVGQGISTAWIAAVVAGGLYFLVFLCAGLLTGSIQILHPRMLTGLIRPKI